jgi:hypothetical protein
VVNILECFQSKIYFYHQIKLILFLDKLCILIFVSYICRRNALG